MSTNKKLTKYERKQLRLQEKRKQSKKFHVATSHLEEKKMQTREQPYKPRFQQQYQPQFQQQYQPQFQQQFQPQFQQQFYPVQVVLVPLESKKKTQDYSRLKCTKPCSYVLNKTEQGEYGVCTREVCTFAHSLEEFVLPQCLFGANCWYKENTCAFKHPNESDMEYYERTGTEQPDLPCTSEKVRVPGKVVEQVLGTENKVENVEEVAQVHLSAGLVPTQIRSC
jgi:hypothetical protein